MHTHLHTPTENVFILQVRGWGGITTGVEAVGAIALCAAYTVVFLKACHLFLFPLVAAASAVLFFLRGTKL
jgi:hypothetical protein